MVELFVGLGKLVIATESACAITCSDPDTVFVAVVIDKARYHSSLCFGYLVLSDGFIAGTEIKYAIVVGTHPESAITVVYKREDGGYV